jgi:hypothetical protein
MPPEPRLQGGQEIDPAPCLAVCSFANAACCSAAYHASSMLCCRLYCPIALRDCVAWLFRLLPAPLPVTVGLSVVVGICTCPSTFDFACFSRFHDRRFCSGLDSIPEQQPTAWLTRRAAHLNLTTRSRESYVANAAGIFDDRGLSAAASGACSVSIVRSNTLFKIINDMMKRCAASSKDAPVRSSLFHPVSGFRSIATHLGKPRRHQVARPPLR